MNDMMSLDPATILARLEADATRFTSPTGAGNMVWRSWGSGPALVLLHGGSGSWRHWVRNISYFARTRHVLAPDLPGLGESDLADRPWTAIRMGEIVAHGLTEILGAAEIYDIAGFSYGGMIAGHVASLPQAPVRSLTLIGSSGLDLPRDQVALEKVRDKTGTAKMAGHRINLTRFMIHDPARVDDLAVIIQDWNSDHNRFDGRPLARSHTLHAALEKTRARMHGI
jgi:pimeloyl-ACP methyl ester carboxylesterase